MRRLICVLVDKQVLSKLGIQLAIFQIKEGISYSNDLSNLYIAAWKFA